MTVDVPQWGEHGGQVNAMEQEYPPFKPAAAPQSEAPAGVTDFGGFRASEDELVQAVDVFDDAVYLVALDDTLIQANKAFYRLTGLTPEQALGRDVSDIMHPNGEIEKCPVCQARADRRDCHVIVEPASGNRFSRPVEVMVRVLRDDEGRPRRILMALRDLARIRQIETELRRYRTKLEQLVNERTAELKRTTEESEALLHALCRRLVRTDENVPIDPQQMARVVSYARARSDQLRREPCSLSQLARDSLDRLQQRDPGRTVDIHIDESPQVSVDAGALRLVLDTLLGNAWEHTRDCATARIRVGVDNNPTKPIYCVEDNGVGFDTAFAESLFSPVAGATTGLRLEGPGPGLVLAHKLIGLHGGELWAQGEPGKGATFFFTL